MVYNRIKENRIFTRLNRFSYEVKHAISWILDKKREQSSSVYFFVSSTKIVNYKDTKKTIKIQINLKKKLNW